MDLRKSKTKIKHGISSRGTSDRLKQQSVNDRALKRSEMTKRFRGAGDIADTHVKLSQDALHMTVMSIKVRLPAIQTTTRYELPGPHSHFLFRRLWTSPHFCNQ